MGRLFGGGTLGFTGRGVEMTGSIAADAAGGDKRWLATGRFLGMALSAIFRPVTIATLLGLVLAGAAGSDLARAEDHRQNAPGEFDFGLMTVRGMSALGLVTPTRVGLERPNDLGLSELSL